MARTSKARPADYCGSSPVRSARSKIAGASLRARQHQLMAIDTRRTPPSDQLQEAMHKRNKEYMSSNATRRCSKTRHACVKKHVQIYSVRENAEDKNRADKVERLKLTSMSAAVADLLMTCLKG